MKILVVDGQGGGLGRSLIEKLKVKIPQSEITAIGTNSIATANMIKAGADNYATGENSVVYNAGRTDCIIGSIGIIGANSMLGEVTPLMAKAISESDAYKILIPLNKCNFRVAGVADMPLPQKIEDAVNIAAGLSK